jgi:hypothetical protein
MTIPGLDYVQAGRGFYMHDPFRNRLDELVESVG